MFCLSELYPSMLRPGGVLAHVQCDLRKFPHEGFRFYHSMDIQQLNQLRVVTWKSHFLGYGTIFFKHPFDVCLARISSWTFHIQGIRIVRGQGHPHQGRFMPRNRPNRWKPIEESRRLSRYLSPCWKPKFQHLFISWMSLDRKYTDRETSGPVSCVFFLNWERCKKRRTWQLEINLNNWVGFWNVFMISRQLQIKISF